MLFNSFDFAVFLPIVFLLYWIIPNKKFKYQNWLLLFASYLFYAWWDWRFLSLLLFSSILDYTIGLLLGNTKNQKKRNWLLGTSILFNLGLLGVFKYYEFFLQSFVDAFTLLGNELTISRLNIILPLGISFYTFQSISYTIDVYQKKIKPTKDVVSFLSFVSFFPQIVAGPIERAKNLLPQFQKSRNFTYEQGLNGLAQIIWGLFKKIVIADSCALIVNQVFANHTEYSASTLLLGAILFAFQIYGDFSGYSDIAIGTARLFGFRLKQNFALPYFSRDIAEFWRRWHISLTSWFKDYLYIPLGGSKGATINTIRNVIIIFIISGFWHGANWTFIAWGLYNALLFIPLLLLKKNRKHLNLIANEKQLPSVFDLVKMGLTFLLVTIGWIIFRAESISKAVDYILGLFSNSIFSMPYVFGVGKEKVFVLLVLIAFMIVLEWWNRKKETPIHFPQWSLFIQWSILVFFAIVIFLFGEQPQEFIYFQF